MLNLSIAGDSRPEEKIVCDNNSVVKTDWQSRIDAKQEAQLNLLACGKLVPRVGCSCHG